MQKIHRTGLATLTLAAASLGLSACGGGGGGGKFEVTAISVPNNASWEINRPIEMTFSAPVDFNSVNANSISVRTPQGDPALGEFLVKSDSSGNTIPNVIVFQPRCPTEPDLSDAGLEPDGQPYVLQILGADVSVGSALTSTTGAVLLQSQQRLFSTPIGTTAQEVFLDTKLGSPGVVLRPKGATAIVDATHIELSDGSKRYFEIDPTVVGGVKIEDFSTVEPDYPINLFSEATSQFAVIVVFNQPVSPDEDNISSDRIELQFSTNGGSTWSTLASSTELVANCTSAGARVRVEPVGVLPQDADMRVIVSADFQDIVGEQGLLPLTKFSPFRTRSEASLLFEVNPSDPDDSGKILADEIFEGFTVGGDSVGSLEQVTPTFPEPQAQWGNGRLKASFQFLGTGGPGGAFDWVIPAGTNAVLSTDTSTILGGPDFSQGQQQTVVNGIVNVNDFRVEEGATLRIIGPNPAQIFATGKVEIFGTIDVSGLDALPVSQLNSANIPQPGAGSLAGSGKGGRGSPLTTTSSPKGENGFGAGGIASGGGEGGEGGFKSGSNDEARRGAGGGGGSFSSEIVYPALAAEPGKDGAPQAKGALDNMTPPNGGLPGPSVFVDSVSVNIVGSTVYAGTKLVYNDFSGLYFDPVNLTDTLDDVFLIGELAEPRAGTGGGGGGDTMKTDSFPAPTFDIADDKKGGGGGSGGGLLQLLVLGDVVFGANGAIVADGGEGGEGESTSGTNQVGGGGGGGSGGMIVIETTGVLDLSAAPANNAISARGGNGAVGKGSSLTGQGAGGKGGAGVIQIHLESFEAFPTGNVIPPAGKTVSQAIDGLTTPTAWRLYPSYGSTSRARSKPIPLGALAANTPGLLTLYAFDGIDPTTGAVNTTAGKVDPLPPVFDQATTGVTVTAIDPVARTIEVAVSSAGIAAIAATGREYCYDGSGTSVDCSDLSVATTELFSNDVYFRNPELFVDFGVKLTKGAVERKLTIADATLLEVGGGDVVLTFAMTANEGTLTEFVDGFGAPDFTTFEVIPRYFRVVTGSQLDQVPLTQEIRMRIQGLGENASGGPDLQTPLVPWTSDPGLLSQPLLLDGLRFLQFEVTFDLDSGGGGVTGNTVLPELNFLRIPIRF
ncbi:hypothetical protein [Engelhardtia mirabilis]|uniref:SbsA Ig-like domain-containing protein n=1 Tax=Engelhardtia mirabilis TaxID=2528011 RepID=A0A518BP80_9BACT|nr:hypothetical protein Pla133_38870 [Planctomycetes bacterium Pla133]QDV03111.1 hypothetical protein Pla86_38860 [Planctomycetes bacterium Pla86]